MKQLNISFNDKVCVIMQMMNVSEVSRKIIVTIVVQW